METEEKGLPWARYQFYLLIVLSILFLWIAPVAWSFQPDSGFYLGGAESLLKQGNYEFNGYPLLIYYPGFSLLLLPPIAFFGMNFHLLHLYCAAIAVLSLWLLRRYYSLGDYGLPGLLTPVVVALSGIFFEQVLNILSDGAFLTGTLVALLLWRKVEQNPWSWALIGCAVVVAFMPMVRMQGVFLWGAFSLALIVLAYRAKFTLRQWVGAAVLAVVAILPYLLWTFRNYYSFNPEAYNMANSFFFGQKGMALYGVDPEPVDWIDADWKYGVYNLLFTVRDLWGTLFGEFFTQLVRPEVLLVLLAGLLGLGARPWYRKASLLERGYVIFSLLFIIIWALRANSIYTVTRYWFPLLPFVVLWGMQGFAALYGWIRRLPSLRSLAVPYQVALGIAAALVVARGVEAGLYQLQPFASNYYLNSNRVLKELVEYIDENTPVDAVVATSDWGVLPFSLHRHTVNVYKDPEHAMTLALLEKKDVKYLVILGGTSGVVDNTRDLVEQYPRIFVPLLNLDPGDSGESGAVYRVDQGALSKTLGGQAAVRY